MPPNQPRPAVWLAVSIACLLALVAPRAARGDGALVDPGARAAFKEGTSAYDAGRFSAAVDAFRRAYALSGRPQLMFHLAQAADAAGDVRAARDAYASYIAALPTAANRDWVVARVAVLEGRSAGPATHRQPTAQAGPVPSPVTAADLARQKAELARLKSRGGTAAERADALFQVARTQETLGQQRESEASLHAIIAMYDDEPDARELLKERAAQAAFILADGKDTSFEHLAFAPVPRPTLKGYLDEIIRQINDAGTRATQRANALQAVSRFQAPRWTLASMERSGRTYEVLARAVRSIPFVVPSDIRRQAAKLPPDSQSEVYRRIEERVRQVLVEKLESAECVAITHYTHVARAARLRGASATAVERAHTERALASLNVYDDAKLERCLTDGRKQDPSLEPYVRGEFAAPRP